MCSRARNPGPNWTGIEPSPCLIRGTAGPMSSHQPRLSIGIPVFNGDDFLSETLDSLRAQTFDDFEIIISDNASTDRTEEIGRDYVQLDSRIRYSRNAENLGLSRNCNLLPPLARGSLFKWAMADDPYEVRFLEVCLAILDAHPDSVMACTQAQFIDAQGKEIQVTAPFFNLPFEDAFDRVHAVFRYRSWVNSILGVIRLEPLLETKLLPHYSGGDYALLAHLALRGKILESPERLLRRRLHRHASSQVADDSKRVGEMVTGKTGQRAFPEWSRLRDDLRTAVNPQFSFLESLRLLAALGGRMRRVRARFLNELGWPLPPEATTEKDKAIP